MLGQQRTPSNQSTNFNRRVKIPPCPLPQRANGRQPTVFVIRMHTVEGTNQLYAQERRVQPVENLGRIFWAAHER